jgi:hypothetical protein
VENLSKKLEFWIKRGVLGKRMSNFGEKRKILKNGASFWVKN